MKQLTLSNEVKERYFCIHCSYYGYETVKDGEHLVCPKCSWVVYGEKQVKEHFLWSNIYPQLVKNYNRANKIK